MYFTNGGKFEAEWEDGYAVGEGSYSKGVGRAEKVERLPNHSDPTNMGMSSC